MSIEASYIKVAREYIESIEGKDPSFSSEATFRTDLENLLQSLKPDEITIYQESSNSSVDGIPDFEVVRDENTLSMQRSVGFIECKKPDIEISSFTNKKSKEFAQIQKYNNTSHNIIATNYREFILFDDLTIKQRVDLFSGGKSAILDLIELLSSFFKSDSRQIVKKDELAQNLAYHSYYFNLHLNYYMSKVPKSKDENFITKFNTLYKDYTDGMSYGFSIDDFCTSFSETLVYAIFIAKLDKSGKDPYFEFSKEGNLDIKHYITGKNRVLKEFIKNGLDEDYIPAELTFILKNILTNLNETDITSILDETDGSMEQLKFFLYEDFLAHYDAISSGKTKKEKGVYYTPDSVVNFIIRTTNEVIKSRLGKSRGFLSKDVKVLDFATGTGNFLRSLYNEVLVTDKKLGKSDLVNIKEKILNDFYGFELLFTPYIVANEVLKEKYNELVELHSSDTSLRFKPDESLPVYLTNTLNLDEGSVASYMPEFKSQTEKAQKIKHSENILAIVGNPPYNSKSKYKSKEIESLLARYKDGLNERKINLDDDYIKFLAFAEDKVNRSGYGVVATITNNSFLDGLTHRKMREHLIASFDELYIINLHGNSLKKEGDENVFNITVGVSISVFIKHKEPSKEKIVNYYSTLECGLVSREDKFKFLDSCSSLGDIPFTKLAPVEPNYFFVAKDFSADEYESFFNVTDIFSHYNSGIQTKNDSFTIHYTEDSLEKLRDDIKDLSSDEISIKYNISPDSVYGKVLTKARDDLVNNYNPQRVSYRPFDIRYTSLCKKSSTFLARPRYEIMKHFDNRENLGLCFSRIEHNNNFKNLFIINNIIDIHVVSDQTYTAPLYIYSDGSSLLESEAKKPNFTDAFNDFLTTLTFSPSPEEVLSYIYAVMHSTTYRSDYLEYLKIDFPSIPFTTDEQTFMAYSKLGSRLIDLHLLSDEALESSDSSIVDDYTSLDHFVVAKMRHEGNKLTLESSSGDEVTFSNVTADLLEFEIGSYKVVEKWVKYRAKDKVALSNDDIAHIKKMLISIYESIKTIKEIDKLKKSYLVELATLVR